MLPSASGINSSRPEASWPCELNAMYGTGNSSRLFPVGKGSGGLVAMEKERRYGSAADAKAGSNLYGGMRMPCGRRFHSERDRGFHRPRRAPTVPGAHHP